MPRAKRAKQYRKVMSQYCMNFGFRQPYQVLVDSSILADACRFKMDFTKGLQQNLQAKEIKPLVTTCTMRKLYESKGEPGVEDAITLGKTFERRRCGHTPETHPEPLPELECLSSCIDPKGSGKNSFHYCLGTNDINIRSYFRGVQGVPLLYITRSVLILEPMAPGSVAQRSRDERAKLRAEILRPGGKRKRDEDEEDEPRSGERIGGKLVKKAKGPNPLSVKKPKKKPATEGLTSKPKTTSTTAEGAESAEGPKRKRKRKNKSTAGSKDEAAETTEAGESHGTEEAVEA
ncbi:rRNA-processing UTP23 [Apiospora aurea]|uniref:rRNA-processing UTP23 n=1 Tax=Apiospora aurea TaxID=335848 RepID=A0ABR1Q0M9_9PEZI